LFSRLGQKIGQLRNAVSRSEWGARHLRKKAYETVNHDVHAPGVLLIQIDGLGYDQLRRAFDNNKLPFLQRLIRRDHFVLRKFYSGLPSTTAAVQAELFYGVKGAVPAVNYYDRLDRREKNMLDAQDVDAFAAKLEKNHQGLLKGGSSYSNIYSGGAREALFCIQTMNVESMFQDIPWRKVAWFCILYFVKIVRILGLSLIEIGLAVFDMVKGVLRGRNPFLELKFILSRIVVCIVLRELVRVHVKMDIAAGVPIIHANFLGYDEHSHRRGPSSAFAHWTLKGIEGTVKDIMHKAMRSHKRDYHIFIYSDHGQEPTVPFSVRTGKTLREAVREVFCDGPFKNAEFVESDGATPYSKLNKRAMGLLRSSPQAGPHEAEEGIGSNIVYIMAMGPLGHIYLPVRPEEQEMRRYAGQLVREAGIPLVCYVQNREVRCVTKTGDDLLAVKGPEVFGPNHPFLREVTEDFETVCRHAHAGDFVISGWQTEGGSRTLTFPIENGSHGGPGSNETKGFIIFADTPEGADKSCLRPLDLRLQVKTILEKRFPSCVPAVKKQNSTPEIIKVMSYNIHSCLGLDGKLFPARIARIIGRRSPDIVALQEVDRNMDRSGNEDQATLIGEQLGMQSIFFPLLRVGGGEYGLAILSRYPIKEMSYNVLPQIQAPRPTERRGLVWVRLDTHCGPVHFFNTHLSYFKREGYLQMRHIVKRTRLDSLPSSEPVIFCGDLNSGNSSPTYSLMAGRLIDSHKFASGPTFISTYPILRLDYIFHSRHLAPVRTAVINDWECRLASDHLPVSSIFVHDPEIKV